MLVILEDLLTQFVYQLVKAEVYLCLHFIVEELLIEVVQGIVGTVTVQIQWVENVPATQQKVGG